MFPPPTSMLFHFKIDRYNQAYNFLKHQINCQPKSFNEHLLGWIESLPKPTTSKVCFWGYFNFGRLDSANYHTTHDPKQWSGRTGSYLHIHWLTLRNKRLKFIKTAGKSPIVLEELIGIHPKFNKKMVELWASVFSYERLQLWLSTLLVPVHGY